MSTNVCLRECDIWLVRWAVHSSPLLMSSCRDIFVWVCWKVGRGRGEREGGGEGRGGRRREGEGAGGRTGRRREGGGEGRGMGREWVRSGWV